MPELPEVEIVVRHLAPLLRGRVVRAVAVRRDRIIAPNSAAEFSSAIRGAKFVDVRRRGKYLVFDLENGRHERITAIGHLGMTGRMYLAPVDFALPKHAALVMELDRGRFIFEDTRYFGRFVVGERLPENLGPEPLESEFTPEYLERAVKRSAQAIKVKLLDQALVAGIGNIYASEALFRAGISPRTAARRLTRGQIRALWRAIRETLEEAIVRGSSAQLDFTDGRDGLFYFGSGSEDVVGGTGSTDGRKGRTPLPGPLPLRRGEGIPQRGVEVSEQGSYSERFRVYDRAGQPCGTCSTTIRRIVQGARSTFFCPRCQAVRKKMNSKIDTTVKSLSNKRVRT